MAIDEDTLYNDLLSMNDSKKYMHLVTAVGTLLDKPNDKQVRLDASAIARAHVMVYKKLIDSRLVR